MKWKRWFFLLLSGVIFNSLVFAQNVQLLENGIEIGGILSSDYAYSPTSNRSATDTLFSFPGPGTWPAGLAWDGQHFWISEYNESAIYKVNSSGQLINLFPLPDSAFSAGGLTWDGNYLWFVDEQAGMLFKIDTSNGLAVQHFHLPSFGDADPNGFGIAWDGEYLWHTEYGDSAKIFQLDPANGAVLNAIDPPSDLFLGIVWVNGFLYGVDLADFQNPRICKLDPSTWTVVDSADLIIPYPLGIAWDGQYFWIISSNQSVGGNNRIYKMGLPFVSLEKQAVVEPNHFMLMPNYPNPFNPVTTIPFYIHSPGQVSLEVYNVLGEKVKTLVNQSLIPGKYQVQWDGTNDSRQPVSSGIYFYRFKFGNNIQIHKMLLNR